MTRMLIFFFAAALLGGCGGHPDQWDALLTLVPKEGGKPSEAVIKVPAAMDDGSSKISVNIDGEAYNGIMVCARHGFNSSASAFTVGSGGGYAVGGAGETTRANLATCNATLTSGVKSIQCKITGSGTAEDKGSIARNAAGMLLVASVVGLPFAGAVGRGGFEYKAFGTGECETNDGKTYIVQVSDIPEAKGE